MNSKGNRNLKWALFLGPAIFLLFGASPSPDVVLVKLEKDQAARISPQIISQIHVLQELRSYWLVTVPRGLLKPLAAGQIRADILDVAPAGKSYFLVLTPEPGDVAELRRRGHVSVIDDETCLFWSGNREAREILPSHFNLKWMSLEDQVPLSLETAGSGDPSPLAGRKLRIPVYDPRIGQMTGLVSGQNLFSHILDLQNFGTRDASTPGCASAADFLSGYFRGLGLACEFDSFSFSASNYSGRNVVASIPGTSSPDWVIIVGAHYDSYSDQAQTLAPGADDNASGTAAVMEIARIFAGRSFDFTLKFICFSAEEWGLYGSRHFAQAAKSRNEKILAVLNMDMISYVDEIPEDLDLIANPQSEWLANRFFICAARYAPRALLVKQINANMRASDHSAFWDRGYSAVCGIEDFPVKNPYYHKVTDTLGSLNLDFAVSVTGLFLAVAAEIAQPRSQ